MTALNTLRDKLYRQFSFEGRTSPYYTSIEGVVLLKSEVQQFPTHLIHLPSICMVIQGAKSTLFGNKRLDYRAGQARVVNVAFPGASQVTEGDESTPYLSMVVAFDPVIINEVYEQLANVIQPVAAPQAAAFVIDLSEPLLECAGRIVDLLEHPEAAAILFPGLMRELCYWLLTGPDGGVFASHIVATQTNQKLIKVIQTLKNRYDQSLRLEELADIAGMSVSTFHRRFKALTALTPLDYQKNIRLLEARRLMLSESISAENTAYTVGYASASQFSRDYARMFGDPPHRDIKKLTFRPSPVMPIA